MCIIAQICCTLFIVFLCCTSPFLHFCIDFCIKMFCLYNCPILGPICPTDREMQLFVCLFICLVGFVYLFGRIYCNINFLSFFHLLPFCVDVADVFGRRSCPHRGISLITMLQWACRYVAKYPRIVLLACLGYFIAYLIFLNSFTYCPCCVCCRFILAATIMPIATYAPI